MFGALKRPLPWLAAAVVVVAALAFLVIQQASAQDDARGAVSNLRLSSPNEGELLIEWDAPSETPTDYRVVWAPSDENYPSYRDDNTDIKGNAYPTAASHTVSGLAPGAEYKAKVRARFSNGGTNDGPWAGPWSGSKTVTISSPPKATPEPKAEPTPTPEPKAEPTPTPEPQDAQRQVSGQAADDFIPTNFRLTVRNNTIDFEWDAPSSGTVREYQFRWANGTDPTSGTVVTVATDAARKQTLGSRGQTVSGQVRARDDSDGSYGPYTHVLYATPNRETDRQAPTKPGAPTVTPGDGQLTVTWTAPADHGYSIHRYSVRSREVGGSWSTVNNAWRIGIDGDLSYTFSAANGTTREVQVRADSYGGRSAWSASATGTPADPNVLNDYDTDDDSLIEVDSLAKLNAIRWDPDGDALVGDNINTADINEGEAYAAAFPNPVEGMGCGLVDRRDENSGRRCTGYELTANLDFDTNGSGGANDGDTYWNGGEGWEPIGNSPRFTATFEGNDNTIANLFINHPTGNHDRLGLFARLENATVRNLTLTGASVTGDDRVGGLAGQSYGTTVISGVSVSGDVTAGDDIAGVLIAATSGDTTIEDASASGSVTGNGNVGGLVGYNSGAISRSSSSANVFGDENSSVSDRVGGLVGYTSGPITSSFATGSVSPLSNADSVDFAGGLIGEVSGQAVITASYATGSVTGRDDVGGLIGAFINDGGSVVASYATGAVTGGEDVGGLVGSAAASGVVVTASYATGAVTGTTNAGGLIGRARTSGAGITTVTDSYWDTESSGQSTSAGGTGKTGAELRAPTAYGTGTDIYANWNLDLNNADSDNSHATGQDNPWDFGANYNYPTLRNTGGNQKGPGPVGNLAAALNADNNLAVTWSAPTEKGDGTLTGNYAGRYTSDGGTNWTSFTTTGATTHTITSPGTAAHQIEIWAIGEGAAHTRGGPASVTYGGVAPPAAPGGFSVALGNTRSSLFLQWNHVTGATGYDIQYATNSGFTAGVGTATVTVPAEPPTQFTHYLTGLTAGTDYWVRVASVNAGGRGAWTSGGHGRPSNLAIVEPVADSVTEGDAAQFRFSVSPSNLARTITYDVTVNGDFGVRAATGQTISVTGSRTLNLATTDDGAIEESGSVTVTITGVEFGYSTGTPGSATVAVQDAGLKPYMHFNGTAIGDPALVLEPWDPNFTPLTAWEMALSEEPASDVVVSVTSSLPDHVVVDADDNGTFAATENITFTTENWDCVQRLSDGTCIGHFVALKALHDADGDSETLTITIAVVTDQSDDDFDDMDSITINAKTWDDEHWCSRDTPPSCEGEYN